MLCAEINTYSPLQHWNVWAGRKFGILGIGGLGHMDIKLIKGAKVVAFTISGSKFDKAGRLVADEVVLSKGLEQMTNIRGNYFTFHF